MKCKVCGSNNVVEIDSQGNPVEPKQNCPSRFYKCGDCDNITHVKYRHKNPIKTWRQIKRSVRIVCAPYC